MLTRRAADFASFTDQAVLEIQVLHATRALHFLGPYSRFHWNHPGPFFFYLAAPLYALFGHATRSLWLSVWLLNVSCLAGIVACASRTLGRGHAVLLAALLAWQTLCFGPENLCDPWGPYVVVLPFELCAFLAVALASGHRWALPLSVLVATFVVQTNVGTLPAVFALLGAALLFIFVGAARKRNFAALRPWRWPALATVFVVVVTWLLPVMEQRRSEPGNLTKLWSFFGDNRSRHPWDAVFTAASEHLTAILALESDYRVRGFQSAVHESHGGLRVAAALLGVVLAGAGVLAARRRAWPLLRGVVVCAAGITAALLAATRVVGPLMSYLFLWSAGLGTIALFLVLAEAAARLPGGAKRWLHPGSVPFAVGAALGALAWARTEIREVPYFYGLPASEVRDLSGPLKAYLRSERFAAPEVRLGTEHRWIIMAGVLLELCKAEVSFSVESGWRFMFGEQFRPERPADVFIVFGDHVYEEEARNTPGCALLAQNGDSYVFASPHRTRRETEQGEIDDPCP